MRITAGSQPRQIVRETLSRKRPKKKEGWWRGLEVQALSSNSDNVAKKKD
jgi:hypothetical protein